MLLSPSNKCDDHPSSAAATIYTYTADASSQSPRDIYTWAEIHQSLCVYIPDAFMYKICAGRLARDLIGSVEASPRYRSDIFWGRRQSLSYLSAARAAFYVHIFGAQLSTDMPRSAACMYIGYIGETALSLLARAELAHFYSLRSTIARSLARLLL